MLWLALLPYAATGRPCWVQDDHSGGAWFGIPRLVLPGLVVLEVQDADVRFTVAIPTSTILSVRERFPSLDRSVLEDLYKRPDDGNPVRA